MGEIWINTKAKDVATINGTIWNDDIRTIAHVVNRNAEILKDALNRIVELEATIKSQTKREE